MADTEGHPVGCGCNDCRRIRRGMNAYRAGRPARPPRTQGGGRDRWEKTTSSTNRDSGIAQTNFFAGTVGETNSKKKVHVAIDEYGTVIYVRDEDGTVLYDKKNNVGYLPHNLDWSR